VVVAKFEAQHLPGIRIEEFLESDVNFNPVVCFGACVPSLCPVYSSNS
jgi:hypothetical protein